MQTVAKNNNARDPFAGYARLVAPKTLAPNEDNGATCLKGQTSLAHTNTHTHK